MSATDRPGDGEPPGDSDRRESEHERQIRDVVAALLAIAAVIAAVVGGRAALLGEKASNLWQTAIREDVRQGAAIFEDTRFVYEENATPALQVAEAQLLATELRRVAEAESSLLPREVLEAEAASQEGFAEAVEESSPDVADDRYWNGLEYDVGQRLADERARNPELRDIDPDATDSKGSDRSTEATLLLTTTLAVALAFALGALSEGFPRWGRRLVPVGFACAAVGLVTAVVIEAML